MDWVDLVRGLNALGCGIALGILLSVVRTQWSDWNTKTRQHWWALFGWVCFGLEGAVESLVLQTEPGPRVVLQTLVVAWTLKALSIREELHVDPSHIRRDYKHGR